MTTNREDLPLVLEPKHIQEVLGIGRRLTYEMLQDPPFPVQRLGGRGIIKISRDSFFKWLDGTNEQG